MSIAALEQIVRWGPGAIQQQLTTLTDNITAYKKEKGIEDGSIESTVGHIGSIPLGNRDVAALQKRLAENKVIISFRGESIRIAPHLYNDMDDIERLLACLEG